jgi:hypothetical protein
MAGLQSMVAELHTTAPNAGNLFILSLDKVGQFVELFG